MHNWGSRTNGPQGIRGNRGYGSQHVLIPGIAVGDRGPYYSILCHTIPYYSILCHTIPYYAILFHTIPYYAILCHTIPYYSINRDPYLYCLLMKPLKSLNSMIHVQCGGIICAYMQMMPNFLAMM